ncbi:MAG: HPF/RaiA family ribosome-associated protein [Gemmatimonadetes bacterium]|nr:HPF/RaiA family ribosome-associated protein [Gemmatimonadota bacterium]
MRVTITARHCEVSDELRARARELMQRLGKVAGRPHDGQVTFEEDHGEASVELRLHTARGVVHVGSALGPDHRTALDRAAARVRRQLDKSAPSRRRTVQREPQ